MSWNDSAARPFAWKPWKHAVPTVGVFYSGSTLYLVGAPNATASSTPNVFAITHPTGAPPTIFTISDGGTSLGTYNIVQDLRIQFTRRLVGIHINLNGGTIPGNIAINQGTGYQGPFSTSNPGPDDIAIFDGSAAPSGAIDGSVQVSGGNGQEVTNIGGFFSATGVLTAGPVTIGGNVAVNGTQTASDTGEMLAVANGTSINGNVSTSQVDQVAIGVAPTPDTSTAPATVAGNLTVTATGVTPGVGVTLSANVGGNVTVNAADTATNAAGGVGTNVFTFEPATVGGTPTSTTIGGNLSVNLGASSNGNQFAVIGGAATSTTVGGNVTFTDGNAGTATTPDTFVFGDNTKAGSPILINGSLTVQMGTGTNGFTFGSGAVVNTDLTVLGGNGSNDVGGGSAGGQFVGAVYGNVVVNLGNGTNTFEPGGTAAGGTGGVAGQLIYTGGNGSNDVEYNVGAGFNPTVVLNFGSGTNTVNIDTTNILNLTVNGTGSGPNNVFQTGANAIPLITFPTTLNNFV